MTEQNPQQPSEEKPHDPGDPANYDTFSEDFKRTFLARAQVAAFGQPSMHYLRTLINKRFTEWENHVRAQTGLAITPDDVWNEKLPVWQDNPEWNKQRLWLLELATFIEKRFKDTDPGRYLFSS